MLRKSLQRSVIFLFVSPLWGLMVLMITFGRKLRKLAYGYLRVLPALARRPGTPQLGHLADHRQIERACELLYAGWAAWCSSEEYRPESDPLASDGFRIRCVANWVERRQRGTP